MPFIKGKSGNPTGRPNGAKNKNTLTIREKVIEFIESNIDKLQMDFNKLDPEKRLYFFEKMLGYGLPKQTAGSLDINFQSLSDEELDKIIDKLKVSAHDQE